MNVGINVMECGNVAECDGMQWCCDMEEFDNWVMNRIMLFIFNY